MWWSCDSHVMFRWLAGPVVSRPLEEPPAVSSEWRNHSLYDRRLWGSYRCVSMIHACILPVCTCGEHVCTCGLLQVCLHDTCMYTTCIHMYTACIHMCDCMYTHVDNMYAHVGSYRCVYDTCMYTTCMHMWALTGVSPCMYTACMHMWTACKVHVFT